MGNEFTKYINFESKRDWKNYQMYQKVRSPELYYFISQWLAGYYGIEKINYQVINDWVKFDKALKNKLYIFLSTFEEYFKTELLKNVSYVKDKFQPRKKDERGKPNEETCLFINDWKRFLNRNEKKEFTSLLPFIANKKEETLSLINSTFNRENILKINNLRNLIMHFSFIVLPIYQTNKISDENLQNYLKYMNNLILNLYQLLPKKWNKSLISKLKNLVSYNNGEKRKYKNLEQELLMEVLW